MHYVNPDTTLMLLDNTFRQRELYASLANKYSITKKWDVALSTDIQYNTLRSNLDGFVFPKRTTTLIAIASSLEVGNVKMQGSLLGTFVNEKVNPGNKIQIDSVKSAPNKNEFTPAIFVSYKPMKTKDFNVRAFYKKIFRMPTFYKVNGTELGNVCQDLFIANNKMYIISQNGKTNAVGSEFENDGMLVVANAETLKKEIAYNDELATLSWPTHVATLGDNNIYIRDNKGIYLFNPNTKVLNFVEGSTGAIKNRMAVAKGKVFVPASKSVLVLEEGVEGVSHKIDMGATVSGVIKTSDDNIYISTTGTPNKISKISATDYSLIQENVVSEGKLGAGWGATPGISAKGDTIYFSNASTKIYQHIFSSNSTQLIVDAKELVDNANIVYNNLAVNPLTGEVYLNTIKGYGMDFLINNISVFNFSKTEPTLATNYQNYTHFPAGIFFTYDFE